MTMTNMRKLTKAEIQKLSLEHENYDEWNAVISFAKKHFGEEVAAVSVETDSEYNDNGGSYEFVESLEVFDHNDKPLKVIPSTIKYLDEKDIDDEDAVSDAWSDTLSELTASYGRYEASKPPKLSFPEVFVPE
jgi:hypothetical protein